VSEAPVMSRHPRKLLVFIAVLWVVAGLVLLRSLPLDPDARWFDLLLFVSLAAFAETWYVRTSEDSGTSLSFIAHFAAAILLGPAFAIVVAATGLLIAGGLIRRVPRIRLALNLAQVMIAVGVCGLLYDALAASGPISFVADAPALALAALGYLIVNDTLVAGTLSMTGRSFLQEWRHSFRDMLLPSISMAPLGALVAYTYQATPWSLLLYPPLVLVIYNGFKRLVSLQRETDDALLALADSIDRRDHYTSQHSRRVAEYVELMARRLKLAPREADLIVGAARVHDLGKIATDNRVLLKPSPLTPEECEMFRRHAADGAELAGKFGMHQQGRQFIRHHHERWDGTGYPDGLAGAAIPLGARLIAVADAYDSMTSDRPYRRALPPETAITELLHCAGTQFDPAVVQALADALEAEGTVAPSTTLTPEQFQPWQPRDLVTELSQESDPAQLWASASFTIARLLGVPNCDLYRVDDGSLDCVASVRDGAWSAENLGRSVPLAASAVNREALATRTPILVAAASDPRLSDAEGAEMTRWNERARAVIPLLVKDEALGLAVLCETREGRTLTPEQVATAESTCRLIALAVHDAEVIDEQRSQARRLASLLESSRAVAGARSSHEALAVVTRKAVELFGLTSCVAYEHDRQRDALLPRAAWGYVPAGVRLNDVIALDDWPVERQLLESGTARLQCASDADLDPVSRATMEMWRQKSSLTVVMPSADGPMGLLTLWDATCERRYSDDELALARSIAELAGEAVRGAKLLRRLQGLSETDSLTGLANHRKIHELLTGVHARAERYDGRYAIAMLDIDSFKRLNDTFGHQVGDAALRHLAGLLKHQTRASDIAGRCGGDEFMLVLPETAAGDAVLLASKLRDELAEHPYLTPDGEQVPVRASFGIAAYPEDGRDTVGLIAAADANLYASKRRGGNSVSCSEPLSPVALPTPAAAPAAHVAGETRRAPAGVVDGSALPHSA